MIVTADDVRELLKLSRTEQLLLPGEHMVNRETTESRLRALLDITLVPAVARLPAAVPAERRDVVARHALLCRIHGEFEEMPGLSVSAHEAARLFGLRPDTASRILEELAQARVLRKKRDGEFAIPTEAP
jgi:CRP-like cAMP-binding protein